MVVRSWGSRLGSSGALVGLLSLLVALRLGLVLLRGGARLRRRLLLLALLLLGLALLAQPFAAGHVTDRFLELALRLFERPHSASPHSASGQRCRDVCDATARRAIPYPGRHLGKRPHRCGLTHTGGLSRPDTDRPDTVFAKHGRLRRHN